MTNKSILETAILGLERHPLPADVPKVDGEDDARALLLALTRQHFLEKGAAPLSFQNLVPPLPDSGTNQFPAAAAATLLFRIMREQQDALLDEYLELLSARNQHIPPAALPDLLDKALNDAHFAQKIAPLLGSRGEWLTSQVTPWAALIAKIEPERWPTASFVERIQILKNLRLENPSAAVPLLRSTWHEEGWQERQAFLQTLEIGLSQKDAPFLECCLDDKRKEIRKIAAQLYAGIPGSACAIRLQQYARTWIQAGISIVPSDVLSAEALRDGMEHAGNNKASRARYLFGQIDPEFWQTEFSCSPAECMAHFLTNDWAGPILEGLSQSIVSFSRTFWADELLFILAHEPEIPVNITPAKWVKLISPKCLNQAVKETLSASGRLIPEKSIVYKVLLLPGYELEESTILELWSGFKWHVFRNRGQQNWSLFHYRQLWRNIAGRTPRALLKTLREDFESHNYGEWGHWEADLKQFLEMLEFRETMHLTFQP
jgi:hypothetical protein